MRTIGLTHATVTTSTGQVHDDVTLHAKAGTARITDNTGQVVDMRSDANTVTRGEHPDTGQPAWSIGFADGTVWWLAKSPKGCGCR